MPIVGNGQKIATNEEGCLVNRSDWNEDVATAMARADGLELTPDHWKVINFVCEYYEAYQIAPSMHLLIKKAIVKTPHNPPDKSNRKYFYKLHPHFYEEEVKRQALEYSGNFLYELFPQGLYKQLHRYAGLPTPGCRLM